MSLTKRFLEQQTEQQPVTDNLQDAHSDVRRAVRQIEAIENLDQLDFELLVSIAHNLRRAESTLETAINQTKGANVYV